MRRLIAIILGYVLFAPSAYAETLALDQVIERALKASPVAARIERDYQEKLADSTAATTLDNPEFQLDAVRMDKGNAGTDMALELIQPLRLSQLDGTRRTYAATLAQVAATEQKYRIFISVNDISALYMKLWLLQERKGLYERSARDAGNIAGIIHKAASQGQTAVSEATLFSADSLRLETEIDTIAAEITRTKLELAAIAGFSFSGIQAVKPEFSALPNADALARFVENRATLRSVVRDNLAVARQRAALAEADRFPEFGPRFLYNRASNGSEQGIGVGVALRIPLWDNNQAERQRAHASVAAAQAEADSAVIRNSDESIHELRQSAEQMQSRADKYWKKILPEYRKSYDLSRKMLHAGQIQALDLWQVREKLYQVEEAALQSVLDAYTARLALELEIGGKLEEIP